MQFLLPLLAFCCCAPQDPTGPANGRIAARVNDEIITWDQVEKRIKQGVGTISGEQRRAELRQMAKELLLLQEARRRELVVTDEELDKVVEQTIKEMGGREKLEAHKHLFQLTHEEFRERERRDELIRRLYQQIVFSGLRDPAGAVFREDIPPAVIRAAFERNRDRYRGYSRVSVIRLALVWKNGSERVARLRLMESLQRRLKEGYTFDMLAQMYSEVTVPDDLRGGGDSRFLIKGLPRDNRLFSPSTTAALFDALREGEVSPLIEDENTLNLFQLVSKQEQKDLSFEEAQVLITREMRSELQMRNSRQIQEELIRKAYFEPPDLFDSP